VFGPNRDSLSTARDRARLLLEIHDFRLNISSRGAGNDLGNRIQSSLASRMSIHNSGET